MALLNELSPQSGSLDVQGTVAYASQEPWILSGMAGHSNGWSELWLWEGRWRRA
jgi:hypothetical protein